MRFWWETEFLSVKNNKLYLEGISAEDIARQEGTPIFVYSLKEIRRKYEQLKRDLADLSPWRFQIKYALKANPNPKILSTLLACGVGIDAVSPGEIKRALEVGFPPAKIFFTGTSLSTEDLTFALSVPGICLILDAVELLPRLKEVAHQSSCPKPIKIGFRWNPGLGLGFASRVITAGAISPDGIPIKFGIAPDRLEEAWAQAKSFGFKPVGLHQHLGSGWKADDYPVVLEAVKRMISMAYHLEKKWNSLQFLDFGGGFSPRYQETQSLFPFHEYASAIKNHLQEAGLSDKLIIFEPGRYLVAEAGVLLVRVEYVKSSFGHLFACVNAGTFNTLPRPAIYPEAKHEVVNASCVYSEDLYQLTIAGHLCETGDVFAHQVELPLPKPGDILAILHAGAYAQSMASSFNLRPIPREIYLS